MGSVFTYPEIPARTPVPAGKTRICISGWPFGVHSGRAVALASAIQQKEPNMYETWTFFTAGENFRGPNGDGQGGIVGKMKQLMTDEDREKLQMHKTTPFIWLELGGGGIKGIGGRDRFCEWVMTVSSLMADENIKMLATTQPNYLTETSFDTSPGTAQAPLERTC